MAATIWSSGGTGGTFNGGSNDELLAGVYNPEQRRNEVLSRLHASFDKIRGMDLTKETEEVDSVWSSLGMGRGRGRARKTSKPEDVVTMSLKGLESQINNLRKQVEEYAGPHFTKAYRTMQGLCSKLQTELDALDVAGRDDIRKDRKEALMRIDKLAKELAQKSHEDGRSCDECEVKN